MIRFRQVRVTTFRRPAAEPARSDPLLTEAQWRGYLEEIRSSYPKPRTAPQPAPKPAPWWRKFWPFGKV